MQGDSEIVFCMPEIRKNKKGFIGGYTDVKHTMLIHKTSLREEHYVSLSPDSEFFSRWGLGAALWLEEVLRNLFLSCIYIVRNKCLDRLNAYFRQFQRMLVEDMGEQNPSVLPHSLSPGYHLQCQTYWSASSVISRAHAHLVPGKTQNGQAPKSHQGQEGLGKWWQAPRRHWHLKTWFLGLGQYLVPTCVSYKHQLFPYLATQ